MAGPFGNRGLRLALKQGLLFTQSQSEWLTCGQLCAHHSGTMAGTRWTLAMLAAEPRAGRPGTEAPVSTWVYSRPVKRGLWLSCPLSPQRDSISCHYTSSPTPSLQTQTFSHHIIGQPHKQGLLSLKAWGDHEHAAGSVLAAPASGTRAQVWMMEGDGRDCGLPP